MWLRAAGIGIVSIPVRASAAHLKFAALQMGAVDEHEFRKGTLERFRTKHALGLDPRVDTGLREENASKSK
jgi:hypothetical protein